jgi:hypothetical protein
MIRSEMTDFEKNATLGELERVVPGADPNRNRQEKRNDKPDKISSRPKTFRR